MFYFRGSTFIDGKKLQIQVCHVLLSPKRPKIYEKAQENKSADGGATSRKFRSTDLPHGSFWHVPSLKMIKIKRTQIFL